jgi:hypothetical protein
MNDNEIDWAYGAHFDDENILAINITKGKFKHVFFTFGTVKVDNKVEPPRVSFKFEILGYPSERFTPEDFDGADFLEHASYIFRNMWGDDEVGEYSQSMLGTEHLDLLNDV